MCLHLKQMYSFSIIQQPSGNIQAMTTSCAPPPCNLFPFFCIGASEPKSYCKIVPYKHTRQDSSNISYYYFTILNSQLVCFVSVCHTSLVTYNITQESPREMQRKQLPACPIEKVNMSWEKHSPAEAFMPPVRRRFRSIFIVRYHQSIFTPFYL